MNDEFEIKKIGDLLVEKGVLNESKLREAMGYQKLKGISISQALLDLGHVTEEMLISSISEVTRIEFKKAREIEVDERLVKKFSEDILRQYKFFPYQKTKGKVKVLTTDPFSILTEEEIRNKTNAEVEYYLTYEAELEELYEKYYEQKKLMEDLESFDENLDEESFFDADGDADNSPIIKITNSVFKEAIKLGASDIHIAVNEHHVAIRFRIDGILHRVKELPKKMHAPLTSRIKTMANMDITERRKPQDGRIQMTIDNKSIDMRVSTLPSVHGEKTTIRLLDRSKLILDINDIGFEENNLENFRNLIEFPVGIILVTGPTGSGKSSTLYTVINELNDVTKNIITVEDPVEYKLDGIVQVQVNSKIGLTFAEGLRSILRQDPDIILVGEIRDTETAQIAVRASNTGHLVFATLHTNDSVSSLTRLMDMGVEDYLVASTVMGVINQRLVRRICTSCKKSYVSKGNTPERIFFEVPEDKELTLYKGEGCERCNYTGYKGRLPIHELLIINEPIRRMIVEGESPAEIEKKAIENGYKTLKMDGYIKALNGLTTLEEVKKFVIK